MKKIITIVMGMLMLALLSSFLGIFGSPISKKRKIAYEITGKIGKDFEKKYSLEFMGISEEAVDKKYKRIGIELSYRKGTLTKEQGRILLIKCKEDVLKFFNSNTEFRQYMTNVPFTGHNIIVNIFVQPYKNPGVYYPDIAVFTFYNDLLWYKTNSRENRYQYYTEEEETLDEALVIVKKQRPDLFKRD